MRRKLEISQHNRLDTPFTVFERSVSNGFRPMSGTEGGSTGYFSTIIYRFPSNVPPSPFSVHWTDVFVDIMHLFPSSPPPAVNHSTYKKNVLRIFIFGFSLYPHALQPDNIRVRWVFSSSKHCLHFSIGVFSIVERFCKCL